MPKLLTSSALSRIQLLTGFQLFHLIGYSFVAVLFAASLVHAQTNTGQIRGIVKDRAGAVLPDCAVSVTNTANNIKYDLVTDSSGQFRFPSLPVGEYTLHVFANGFRPLSKSGIDLHLGQVIDLNLELEIGELSAVANVTTADGLLATATALRQQYSVAGE